jgi:hypothetical protein
VGARVCAWAGGGCRGSACEKDWPGSCEAGLPAAGGAGLGRRRAAAREKGDPLETRE